VFLPLGPQQRGRRLPVVTFTLIAIHLAFSVAVWESGRREDARFAQAEHRLESVQWRVVERHLGPRAFTTGLDPRRVRGFWDAWESGEIAGRDDPLWIEWDAARRAALDAHSQQLTVRLGMRRDDPTVASLLTSMFVHANALHVIGNMLFLWTVGVSLEQSWGRWLFLATYAFGGLVANMAWLASTPRGLHAVGFGASGAVAAVMGAFLVPHFRTRIRVFLFVPLPSVYAIPGGWIVLPWFVLQLWAMTRPDAELAGVAFSAHVGGFLAGVAVAVAMRFTGTEARVAPVAVREEGRAQAAPLVAEADERMRKGDTKRGLALLEQAAACDPSDIPLRRRIALLHRDCGRREEAAHAARELLAPTWREGDRTAYLALFDVLDSQDSIDTERSPGSPSAVDVHRAAVALEDRDASRAASLHLRVASSWPDDPCASRSLLRCAELYERHGHADAASQLRSRARG
jgi:membrane associated rhomboid family serine protease